jgi:hypothetical protein
MVLVVSLSLLERIENENQNAARSMNDFVVYAEPCLLCHDSTKFLPTVYNEQMAWLAWAATNTGVRAVVNKD